MEYFIVDEGLMWGKVLEILARKAKEGVDVRTVLYRGMDHEFVDRTGYCPQAYDAAAEIAKDVAAL